MFIGCSLVNFSIINGDYPLAVGNFQIFLNLKKGKLGSGMVFFPTQLKFIPTQLFVLAFTSSRSFTARPMSLFASLEPLFHSDASLPFPFTMQLSTLELRFIA